MSRIITVAAGIVATMLADGTSSPAIIGDYRIPNWAEMKSRVSLQEKNTLETKGNATPNRSSPHPLPANEKSEPLCSKPTVCDDWRPAAHIPASRPEANSSASLRNEFLHCCYSADNWHVTQSPVRRMLRRALYRHCIAPEVPILVL